MILEKELSSSAMLALTLFSLAVVIGIGFGVFGLSSKLEKSIISTEDTEQVTAPTEQVTVDTEQVTGPVIKQEAPVIIERVVEKVVVVPTESSKGNSLPWVIAIVLIVAIITGGTVLVMRANRKSVPELTKPKAIPPKTGTRVGHFFLQTRA
jgi:flagellar basal body-associated protein FliL